jgi:hypothetical protein
MKWEEICRQYHKQMAFGGSNSGAFGRCCNYTDLAVQCTAREVVICVRLDGQCNAPV